MAKFMVEGMLRGPHTPETLALIPAEVARGEELDRLGVRAGLYLAACRHCRAYLAQMRRTVDALGRLTEQDVEPDAEAALRRAFRGWKRA